MGCRRDPPLARHGSSFPARVRRRALRLHPARLLPPPQGADLEAAAKSFVQDVQNTERSLAMPPIDPHTGRPPAWYTEVVSGARGALGLSTAPPPAQWLLPRVAGAGQGGTRWPRAGTRRPGPARPRGGGSQQACRAGEVGPRSHKEWDRWKRDNIVKVLKLRWWMMMKGAEFRGPRFDLVTLHVHVGSVPID